MRAIALGTLADILGTKLFLLALVLVLIDPGSSAQAPLERITPELLQGICLAWGLFFTGLGGFVAARLAGSAPLVHATLVGLASGVISQMFYGWTPAEVGPALYVVGMFLSPTVALAGGRVAGFLSRR